nr:hypothetical protein GCM10025699_01580 [Microbacterium flavescens]
MERDHPDARRHRDDGVPRIAAAAEAGWSPATDASELRTWDSFRERVGSLGPLWTSLGIGFHPSDEIDWATE